MIVAIIYRQDAVALAQDELLILERYQVHGIGAHELVDRLLHPAGPPTAVVIVVTQQMTTRLEFLEEELEVTLDELVGAIAVDIDPVEMCGRQRQAEVIREPTVDDHLTGIDLAPESHEHGFVPRVHFVLAALGTAAVPRLFLGGCVEVLPRIDEVEASRRKNPQNFGGEIAKMDADFGSDGATRQEFEQRHAAAFAIPQLARASPPLVFRAAVRLRRPARICEARSFRASSQNAYTRA